MSTEKYSIQIVQGDKAIAGFYVAKHKPDPSGLRLGVTFTRDRKLARVFSDHSVAERLLSKLAARGTGCVYEIVTR